MSTHAQPPRTTVPLNENANILAIDPGAERLKEYLLTWCEVADGKLPPRALKSVGLSRLPTLPNELHPGWLLALGNDSFGALNHLGELLDANPDDSDIQLLSAICLQRVRNYPTSSSLLATLIKKQEVYAPFARHYLANALLSVGKLNQGFRYLGPGNRPLTDLEKTFFNNPEKLWSGQELSNQNLVLVGNSDLIDELFYLRYIKSIKELLPSNITYVCSSELVGFANTIDLIDHAATEATEDYSYFLPIEYMPSIIAAKMGKVPAQLTADANRDKVQSKRARLLSNKPTLGIKWRDDESQEGTAIEGRAVETNRNLDVESLTEILDQLSNQYHIVCLQKDLTSAERVLMAQHQASIVDENDLNDHLTVAEWLSALDQVLTIDCSLVELIDIHHLTSTVLLPYSTSWRWNAHNWHPTQKTIQKVSENSWKESIPELVNHLSIGHTEDDTNFAEAG